MWNDQREANRLFGELKTLRKLWDPITHLETELHDLLELTEHASPIDLMDLEREAAKLEGQWKQLESQLYLSGNSMRVTATSRSPEAPAVRRPRTGRRCS